jgi:hypothetical protein
MTNQTTTTAAVTPETVAAWHVAESLTLARRMGIAERGDLGDFNLAEFDDFDADADNFDESIDATAAEIVLLCQLEDKPVVTAVITGRGEASTVPDNAGAVDAEISVNGEFFANVTLLPGNGDALETWGTPYHWATNDYDAAVWIADEIVDAARSAVEVSV